MQELRAFISFLRHYFQYHLVQIAYKIEHFKDIIVAFLIVKRGRYSSSFLNTSFFILVAAALIGAPTIAENNPFISSLDQSKTYTAGIVAYNPYENSLSTIISSKPRDKVIDYQ